MDDLHGLHHQHLEALRRLHRRNGTLKSYATYVGAFLRFLEERGVPATLEALTPEMVGDAQDWLRARSMGSRDGAVAEYALVMRTKSFARWLWRRRFVKHDPLDRLERPRLAKVYRRPYTETDVRHLLWAASQGPSPVMERAMLLLQFDTGCRIGELCGVVVGDLDLDKGAVVFRQTKNGRPRRVIVRVDRLPDGSPSLDGGPCMVSLREWLAERTPEPGVDALFLNRFGEPLSSDQARRIWRQLGELGQVSDPIPHRGRHTHATELLAEMPGAELHLRNRLGQLSEEVLKDYVTISDPMAQRVADAASLSTKWNL